MISFLKLIRYKNLLMVLLTMALTKYALIDSFVNQSVLSNFQFVILAISVLCITAGGYIVNDIFDIEADKINKPNKTFVEKVISKKWTSKYYFILNIIGITLGILVSISISKSIYSLIFPIIFIGLYYYSKNFKKKVLLGNLLVSLFVSLIIYIIYLFNYSWINSNEVEPNLLYLFSPIYFLLYLNSYLIFSFLTTLIREIIKDIEDINGDLKLNAKTLPIVFGRKRASKVAFSFSVLLLILLIIVLKSFLIDYPLFLGYSIIFILLPLLYFMYKLWNAKSKKDYSYLSKLMKLIMFFGILSMLFFKLN